MFKLFNFIIENMINNKKRKALPLNDEDSDGLLEEKDHLSKKPKRLSDQYYSESKYDEYIF